MKEIISNSTLPDEEKAKADALLACYPGQWDSFNCRVLDAEVEVVVQLPGTNWIYVGKIDLLCEQNDQLIMIEHKTKTGEINNLYDPYWQRLAFDGQISAYYLAQYGMRHPIERTIYDVIRKISTRPKRIPKGKDGKLGTQSEIAELGTYYGVELDEELQECPPESELVDLYSHRIKHEVAQDSDKYFKQYSAIDRTRDQLADYTRQLIHICNDIDRAQLDGSWYQNTSNCFSYGSTCEYFSLCRGVSSPDNPQDWEPRTGSSLSGDSSISHSRATCFQSCRRKYYWRYVEKIQPVRSSSIHLDFGKVVHDALESYWLNRKGET